MIVANFTQEAAASIDRTINWQTWLAPSERITSAAWILEPTGLVLGVGPYAPFVSSDGKKTTAWFSGGVAGVGYVVTCTITTDNVPPRVESLSITITVE